MMVQVKKADVREAILEGAFDLFLTHGYTSIIILIANFQFLLLFMALGSMTSSAS
jgi:hypothetical protein